MAFNVGDLEPQNGSVFCAIQVGKAWVHGTNSSKTSPALVRVFADGNVASGHHAEMRAIQLARRLGGKIRKVVVIRWNKAGLITMAKPCAHCERMLLDEGIRPSKIWFSNWNREMEQLSSD